MKPFLDFSIAEWDEVMDNNAKSAFLMTRLVLRACWNGAKAGWALGRARLAAQSAGLLGFVAVSGHWDAAMASVYLVTLSVLWPLCWACHWAFGWRKNLRLSAPRG